MTDTRQPGIHRAWIVAAVTFLTLIAAAAFRSTTSVLFEPLESDFGWSRTDTSLAVTVNLVFYGLTAPFAAVFMERFTIRRTVIIALALIGFGTGLTVFMTEVWQLVLLWGVFVGLGTGSLALVFGAVVANRWFETRKGLVTGIFSAAYATGQLLFLPLIAALVMQVGWQIGSLIVTAFVMFVMPIFWTGFREKPADVGLLPYGATTERVEQKAPSTARETLSTLRAAMQSKAFWILAGTFFVCGWTTNGLIGAHFIPAAHDHGMPATTAAGLLALVGIFDFIGTIGSGWLTDRVDSRILLVIYYGFRGLALFTVPFVLGPTVEPPLMFFVVFYGLDWIATVPPTIALTRKYFGLAKTGVIYGWIFASHMVGAAIAAAFAGLIRDVQGDYFIAWITAAVLCLVAAGSFIFLRNDQKLVAEQ
ncbi:MFS transporter [Candidatus Rhodoluna planktonica]|uniref:MFS transporter n=1 Tax=Candidatus Rhodoluna planktonica TaxID=535712 RepID=A0A1D9DXR5_9MICO|nr:MFS transporter [Candidatus Rhodoluna planktonica]AOY55589.1 MFS transporter [Candidatus Rhodoluna planktonica]